MFPIAKETKLVYTIMCSNHAVKDDLVVMISNYEFENIFLKVLCAREKCKFCAREIHFCARIVILCEALREGKPSAAEGNGKYSSKTTTVTVNF